MHTFKFKRKFRGIFCIALLGLAPVLRAWTYPPAETEKALGWLKLRAADGGFDQTCDLLKQNSIRARISGNETLYFSYAIRKSTGSAHPPFLFRVTASGAGKTKETLFQAQRSVQDEAQADRWRNAEVKLRAFGGHEVTIEFEAAPIEGKSTKDRAVWGGVRIGDFTRKRGEKNVILICLDTLRGDRIGVAGYPRDVSKNLDALARKGVYFPMAVSAAPWTKPSIMTVLTGVNPSFHGITKADIRVACQLPRAISPLSEILKKHGYVTQAFTGSQWVSAYFGYSRGYDRYEERTAPTNRDAESIFTRGGNWAITHRDQKFFLFLHTYEIHEPYHHKFYGHKERSRTRMQEANDRYDSGVRYTDGILGMFLKELEAQKLMNDTIIVVFGDHGDEIGYNDSYNHGRHGHHLGEILLRVPLIFYAPGLSPAVIQGVQARLLDTAPTILELVGVPSQPGMQGKSMVSLMKRLAPPPKESFVISEILEIEPQLKSVRWMNGGQTYKYVAQEKDLVLSTPTVRSRLFDLTADPSESNNVMGPQSTIALRLHQALGDYVRSVRGRADRTVRGIKVDAETQERLRSLGY